jgi:hypothetical protein
MPLSSKEISKFGFCFKGIISATFTSLTIPSPLFLISATLSNADFAKLKAIII